MTISIRETLIKNLKGKTIRVRDLGSILPGWPQRVSPDVEELRNRTEARLDILFEGRRLAKIKAVDIAGFAASWWPYASFEQLQIATCLSGWLFAWDDEIDSMEMSAMPRNYRSAEDFRLRTSKFVEQSLGFNVAGDIIPGGLSESNPLITSFGVVGEALMTSYTYEQRQYLLEQIEFFLDMSVAEHEATLGASLPTVEQYLVRRMGTGAVRICLALTDFCHDMQLPPSVMRSEALKRLSDETNIIICTINDILSVHKEIAHGQVDTLIPLLYHKYGNVQTATDVALIMVKTAVNNFEDAAHALLQTVVGDETLTQNVNKFIEGCRYACTANSSWSLDCKRYCLKNARLDGEIEITI